MKMKKLLFLILILATGYIFADEKIVVQPTETPITSPGYIPTQKEVLQYRADKLYNEKKYNEALPLYLELIKTDNKNIKIWKQIGYCYYKLNNHNYAYNIFKKVLELDKNDKDAKDFMNFYNNLIEKKQKQSEKRTWFDPLWRSALIPGWGQVYNNQLVKGLLFGGAFITSVGITIYCVQDENTKYDRYLKTNENHELAFNKAQEAYNSALIWGVIASVVYAGNLVDASINYNCEEARQAFLKFDKESIYLSYLIRW